MQQFRFLLGMTVLSFLLLCSEALAQSTTIATCGSSKGHSYYADRNLAEPPDVGWRAETTDRGRFSLVRNEGGTLDFIYPDAEKKYSTYVATGGTLMPIGISENSITIVAIKPEFTTSETYVFHKLRDGTNQVMWTRVKAETPLPTAGAFIAVCESLNLSAIEK